jgi:hypothetical protein
MECALISYRQITDSEIFPKWSILKGKSMKSFRSAAVVIALLASPGFGSQVRANDKMLDTKFELPPEITPAIRAACESNVRQLCVTPTSTTDSVVSCVRRNFINLNKKCRNELTSAGLM